MNNPTSLTAPRPVLSLALLLCTLAMSGCMEEACNVVGPSETSSHESTDIAVLVTYRELDAVAPIDATVTSSRSSGSVTVEPSTPTTLGVRGLVKGDTVNFRVTAGSVTINTTCVWNGRVGLLYDAKLDVLGSGSGGTQVSAHCVGW
jgi:hypothetical protein